MDSSISFQIRYVHSNIYIIGICTNGKRCFLLSFLEYLGMIWWYLPLYECVHSIEIIPNLVYDWVVYINSMCIPIAIFRDFIHHLNKQTQMHPKHLMSLNFLNYSQDVPSEILQTVFTSCDTSQMDCSPIENIYKGAEKSTTKTYISFNSLDIEPL